MLTQLMRVEMEKMLMDSLLSLHAVKEMYSMDVFHTAILMMDGIYMQSQQQVQSE